MGDFVKSEKFGNVYWQNVGRSEQVTSKEGCCRSGQKKAKTAKTLKPRA